MSTHSNKMRPLCVEKTYTIDAQNTSIDYNYFCVKGTSEIIVYVKKVSGDFTDGVVGLKLSPDNDYYYDVDFQIIGENYDKISTNGDYIKPYLISSNSFTGTIEVKIKAH